jgi:hypothetical protein
VLSATMLTRSPVLSSTTLSSLPSTQRGSMSVMLRW